MMATVPHVTSGSGLLQHLVPVPMLLVIVSLESGYTASWAVGHQLLTTEAQNKFEHNPCEICGRQSHKSLSSCFGLPVNYHFTDSPHSFTCHPVPV